MRMLEWMTPSGLPGPAESVGSMPPFGCLRLNHVERVTRAYENDPALGLSAYDAEKAAPSAFVHPSRTGADRKRTERCFGPFTFAELAEGRAALLSYDGLDAVVCIPDEIEGLSVSSLTQGLFRNCSTVREVRIPSSVEYVDRRAFEGCCNLETLIVALDSPWFSSDGMALYSSDGKRLVRLVVSVESYEVACGCVEVADHAFDSLSAVRHVVLPEGVAKVGRLAFAKTKLASLRLPSTLKELGEQAFFHCSDLRDVDLPLGLLRIGENCFAHSSLSCIEIPASVESIGLGAFSDTPAQKCAARGSIRVSPSNPLLSVDESGGLYKGEMFVELVGVAGNYCVRSGTTSIGGGAFRRHAGLRCVVLPEGLEHIGEEAFRGARSLQSVVLPDSLRSIGARAFLDTAVRTLHLGPLVEAIGEHALLVQGDNPLTNRAPLESVDVDPSNRSYYVQQGLLCERKTGAGGGDTVLHYFDSESSVSIPCAVSKIASLAFCGSSNMDELSLHAGIRSICAGAFSTRRAPRLLKLEFAEEVEGTHGVSLVMPRYTTRYRSLMPLFETSDTATGFNFEYYDTWVAHEADLKLFLLAVLGRFAKPIRLTARCRQLYEGIISRKASSFCLLAAKEGRLDALLSLHALGLLDSQAAESALSHAMSEGATQATACLLEFRRRVFTAAPALDFSL